ncbi:MAG: hypothetical protein U5J97_03065 [Trueperaceae bacterium]|nr:hypothetical protein [Trueperaceae bacterium]
MNPPFETGLARSFLLAAAWLMVVVGPAVAADPASPGAETGPPTTPNDWIAWVDSDQGFLIELPPSHALAPAGGQWFLHGFFGGEPTVPDATITFLPGRDLPRALKESFPVDATTEPLTFGDAATSGLRVTSLYETPGGTPYEESGYLIEAPGGTYRIGRYESFDWAPFDAAARSFRHVRLVTSGTRD